MESPELPEMQVRFLPPQPTTNGRIAKMNQHSPIAAKALFAGTLVDELTISMMTKALRDLRGNDISNVSFRAVAYWIFGIPFDMASRLDMDAVRVELLRRVAMDEVA
jgi:hypothetical protein